MVKFRVKGLGKGCSTGGAHPKTATLGFRHPGSWAFFLGGDGGGGGGGGMGHHNRSTPKKHPEPPDPNKYPNSPTRS